MGVQKIKEAIKEAKDKGDLVGFLQKSRRMIESNLSMAIFVVRSHIEDDIQMMIEQNVDTVGINVNHLISIEELSMVDDILHKYEELYREAKPKNDANFDIAGSESKH